MHCFSDLFDTVLYMFRTGPLSIIRSISTLYTRSRYLSCWLCWLSGGVVLHASRQPTELRYSWWWTVDLSETCRVLYEINLRNGDLVGFYYKNSHSTRHIIKVIKSWRWDVWQWGRKRHIRQAYKIFVKNLVRNDNFRVLGVNGTVNQDMWWLHLAEERA